MKIELALAIHVSGLAVTIAGLMQNWLAEYVRGLAESLSAESSHDPNCGDNCAPPPIIGTYTPVKALGEFVRISDAVRFVGLRAIDPKYIQLLAAIVIIAIILAVAIMLIRRRYEKQKYLYSKS